MARIIACYLECIVALSEYEDVALRFVPLQELGRKDRTAFGAVANDFGCGLVAARQLADQGKITRLDRLADAREPVSYTHLTAHITTRDKRKLLWLLSLITFFMSAALDNMTTRCV